MSALSTYEIRHKLGSIALALQIAVDNSIGPNRNDESVLELTRGALEQLLPLIKTLDENEESASSTNTQYEVKHV